MDFLDSLFSRGKEAADTKRAIAFIDYEHWFYSYRNLFHMTPDLVSWRKELEQKYTLEDVMVFADFSMRPIADSLNSVRAMTNTVISTQQSAPHHKKDMTDFIMLDYIYQVSAERSDVGTYILFTGDGHFQSVVKYLTQKMGKQVIVYGVTNATSKRLKDVATELYEIPTSDSVIKSCYSMIVDNLAYVSTKSNIIPSFNGTVAAVARHNGVEEPEVAAALQEMLDKGLVVRKDRRVDFNRTVKVITANWEALIAEGLWDPSRG